MLLILPFERGHFPECLGYWIFEVVARLQGFEEPFEV